MESLPFSGWCLVPLLQPWDAAALSHSYPEILPDWGEESSLWAKNLCLYGPSFSTPSSLSGTCWLPWSRCLPQTLALLLPPLGPLQPVWVVMPPPREPCGLMELVYWLLSARCLEAPKVAEAGLGADPGFAQKPSASAHPPGVPWLRQQALIVCRYSSKGTSCCGTTGCHTSEEAGTLLPPEN